MRYRHDDLVFRLCSLWFNNETDVSDIIEQEDELIATYKWLPLIYQLAVRCVFLWYPKPFLTWLLHMAAQTGVDQ